MENLEKHQNKPQNLNILPGLELSDISKSLEETVGETFKVAGLYNI